MEKFADAAERPIRFAGAALDKSRHVCAFFDTSDEEYAVLLPFIKEGFERGEKAFHIVDPKLRNDHLRRLADADVDVAAAEKRGQLEVRNWEEAYLREGHFDQNAMLALIQVVLNSDKDRYPLTRLVAHMEWALEDREGVNDLVEYETRLTTSFPGTRTRSYEHTRPPSLAEASLWISYGPIRW